ncbi:flagellar hook-basal body protein [Mesoaciditoga sp.]
MHTGFYTATMGMLVEQAQVDTISNNLANVNSPGYKSDSISFKAMMKRPLYEANEFEKKKFIGDTYNAVVVDTVQPNMQEGTIKETHGKFDYAIEGRGFFAVRDGKRILYTRNGSFGVSEQGYLVDKFGREVLNASLTPVNVLNGEKPAVFDVKNEEKLQKVGDTSFVPTKESGKFILKPDAKVLNGYLEMSNVNVVRQMVDLINAYRHYEISQRVITTEDTLFSTALRVGSPR